MELNAQWLDFERRPNRQHLLRLHRSQQPQAQSADPSGRLVQQLQQRWAERVGLPPEQVLLCRSPEEGLRLVCDGLLTHGDTVNLARPAPTAWLAAVLSAGATFVDIGRLNDGRSDPAVIAAVPTPRLVIAGAPALSGAEDVSAWQGGAAPIVADATGAARLVGGPVSGASVTLAALRDPSDPRSPLLWALLGPPAAPLRYLMGPSLLPASWANRCLAALRSCDDSAEAELRRALSARATSLEERLPLSAGQSWLPAAGMVRAIRCLAADGASLVPRLTLMGAAAEAHGAFPGRGLVVVSL